MSENKKQLVFDIPTRLFHWAFALGFLGAFSIGKFVDDDNTLYPLHMFFGALMAIAVFLRIVWGLVGTKFAKFSSFKLNPADLLAYLKSIASGAKKPTMGRNSASSFAAISMMLIALIIPLTGFFMLSATTRAQMHDFKEIHEALATIFALIAVLHILGIVIHTISQKDPIGLSMVNGYKNSVEGEQGIANSRIAIGALFIALIGGAAFALNSQYDGNNKTFKLGQKTLTLGEKEGQEGEHEERVEGKEGKDREEEHEKNEKHEKHEADEKGEYSNKVENIATSQAGNGNKLPLTTNKTKLSNHDEDEKEEHETRENHENREIMKTTDKK